MSEGASKPGLSKTRNMLSSLLFVVAGVLLVVALYLFWQDRNEPDTPSAPTAIPGQAQLNTVHDALEAEGLDVEYGQGGSARVEDLTPPGQLLIAEGNRPMSLSLPASTSGKRKCKESLRRTSSSWTLSVIRYPANPFRSRRGAMLW